MAADRWEVVRHYGDNRQSVISHHKSIELAEAAYAVATGEDWYAVDVSFLEGGHVLNFEPLFGIANGYAWVAAPDDLHGAIYADEWLNDRR